MQITLIFVGPNRLTEFLDVGVPLIGFSTWFVRMQWTGDAETNFTLYA